MDKLRVYIEKPITVKHSINTTDLDEKERDYYRSIVDSNPDMFECSQCHHSYDEDNGEHSLVISHVQSLNHYCFLTDCCRRCNSIGQGEFKITLRMDLYDDEGKRRKSSYYK